MRSVLCLLAFLPLSFAPARSDDALRRRVTDEAPRALARLEKAYEQVIGTGTHQYYKRRPKQDATGKYVADFDAPEYLFRENKVGFRIQGPLKKLCWFKNPDDPRGGDPPAEQVYCLGPELPFQLHRAEPGGPVTVKGLGEEQRPETERRVREQSTWFLFAPFMIHVHNLNEFMSDPKFQITDVSRVSRRDGEAVKVEFTCRFQKSPLRSGWVILSPRREWAVEEYDVVGEDRSGALIPHFRSVTIDYEDSDSAVPKPKRVTSSLYSGAVREVYDFGPLSFEATPQAEFTLASYGLAGMKDPARRPSVNRMAYWFVGIALAALAITVAMRYGAARSQRA